MPSLFVCSYTVSPDNEIHCTDLKQTNMARLLWQREMPGLRIAEERNVEIKSDLQTL